MASAKIKSGSGYKSKAQPKAVYRGQDVKIFSQDLSNYAELRRGLSPQMRAQTMTKTELKKVSPEACISYINALNQWRQSPQAGKIVRGQASEITDLERIFVRLANSGTLSGDEKAALMEANIRMKSKPQEQARMEIREALNAVDRAHAGDWYTPSDYWATKFYMEHGEWDPAQASDNMLRIALTYGFTDDFPYYEEATKDEYIARLGGENADQMLASDIQGYRNDIIAVAKMINIF